MLHYWFIIKTFHPKCKQHLNTSWIKSCNVRCCPAADNHKTLSLLFNSHLSVVEHQEMNSEASEKSTTFAERSSHPRLIVLVISRFEAWESLMDGDFDFCRIFTCVQNHKQPWRHMRLWKYETARRLAFIKKLLQFLCPFSYQLFFRVLTL